MKYILAVLLFLLPASFVRLLFKRSNKYVIDKGAKVGFSLILVDSLHLKSKARIGHFNLISVKKCEGGG